MNPILLSILLSILLLLGAFAGLYICGCLLGDGLECLFPLSLTEIYARNQRNILINEIKPLILPLFNVEKMINNFNTAWVEMNNNLNEFCKELENVEQELNEIE